MLGSSVSNSCLKRDNFPAKKLRKIRAPKIRMRRFLKKFIIVINKSQQTLCIVHCFIYVVKYFTQ